jgi:hypothetical protein
MNAYAQDLQKKTFKGDPASGGMKGGEDEKDIFINCPFIFQFVPYFLGKQQNL